MPSLSKKKKKTEIELELLPSGELQIRRSADQTENEAILELLREVGMDDCHVTRFLKQGELIKYLIGDISFCG